MAVHGGLHPGREGLVLLGLVLLDEAHGQLARPGCTMEERTRVRIRNGPAALRCQVLGKVQDHSQHFQVTGQQHALLIAWGNRQLLQVFSWDQAGTKITGIVHDGHCPLHSHLHPVRSAVIASSPRARCLLLNSEFVDDILTCRETVGP